MFVHSVKVIEHFYWLNDASAVFSNWNIGIAKLSSAVQTLKGLKEKYPDLEKFAVHYNFARCLEMGTVGQGRKPYNTYSIIWVSSISSTVLNRWSFVEHSWTMYTPGQEGGRETKTYGLGGGGWGCGLKSIQTSTRAKRLGCIQGRWKLGWDNRRRRGSGQDGTSQVRAAEFAWISTFQMKIQNLYLWGAWTLRVSKRELHGFH